MDFRVTKENKEENEKVERAVSAEIYFERG